MKRKPTDSEYRMLWGVLAYQFDTRVARALLTPRESIEVIIGSTGRVRYVVREGVNILTLRAPDNLFSLSLRAAEIILGVIEPPRYRVVIRGDREIRGSVLGRDVVRADPLLRPGDEVVIVDEEDSLVAVGRAKLPGDAMMEGVYGEVVRVRRRNPEWKPTRLGSSPTNH